MATIKPTENLVKIFDIDGKLYSHYLNFQDDQVRLRDTDGNILLIFTSDCYVIVPGEQKYLAHYSQRSTGWVCDFLQTGETITADVSTDLYAFEVKISEYYLKQKQT